MKRESSNALRGGVFGVGLIVASGLLSVGKDVLMGRYIGEFHPIAFVAVCFTMVAVTFALMNIRQVPTLFRKIMDHKGVAFGLNLSTAASWIGYFYTVKYFEPAVAVALVNSIAPIATMLVEPLLVKVKASRGEVFAALGIIPGLTILAATAVTGKSGIGDVPAMDLMVGGLCALLSGSAFAFNVSFSKRLANAGWKAKEVMSTRFVLLVVLAMLLAPTGTVVATWTSSYIGLVVLVALIGIVLNLYLLQRGIERTEPLAVALILTNTPVAAFAIGMLDPRVAFSSLSLLGIILCVVFSSWGVVLRVRRIARTSQAVAVEPVSAKVENRIA